MGEPLQNYDAVVPALRLMLDDHAYGLSRRRVTLSTSGMVPQIDRLADDCPVALAVSLHASNDALRDRLVPLNRKYPLRELLAACSRYLRSAPRDFITFEYVMLDGVNDTDAHADELIELVRDVPCKFNLIPFNPFPDAGLARSSPERIRGVRAASRRCRHRDHHAQDAGRRYRRGLRATGRRGAGPHASQRAQQGTCGADRFGDPLRRADDTGASGGGRCWRACSAACTTTTVTTSSGEVVAKGPERVVANAGRGGRPHACPRARRPGGRLLPDRPAGGGARRGAARSDHRSRLRGYVRAARPDLHGHERARQTRRKISRRPCGSIRRVPNSRTTMAGSSARPGASASRSSTSTARCATRCTRRRRAPGRTPARASSR